MDMVLKYKLGHHIPADFSKLKLFFLQPNSIIFPSASTLPTQPYPTKPPEHKKFYLKTAWQMLFLALVAAIFQFCHDYWFNAHAVTIGSVFIYKFRGHLTEG